jgi:DNA helicase-2/ATP-dependent DNA helicase PcrA
MIERMKVLVGNAAERINTGTFHHLANICLKEFAEDIGFTSNFSIYTQRQQDQLIHEIIHDLYGEREFGILPSVEEDEDPDTMTTQSTMSNSSNTSQDSIKLNRSDILNVYSKSAAYASTVHDVLERDPDLRYFRRYERQIKRILSVFMRRKKLNNAMDYDDLLVNFQQFLSSGESRESYLSRFQHVVVDEYQDVNVVQDSIIDLLSKNAKSLTVVGDDGQAIYGFRGADSKFMLNFPEKHSVEIKRLEQNFRSTPEIVALANASIALNTVKFDKHLYSLKPSGKRPVIQPCNTPSEEGDFVADLIETNYREKGIPYKKQAILIRSGYQSPFFEQSLRKLHIQFSRKLILTNK